MERQQRVKEVVKKLGESQKHRILSTMKEVELRDALKELIQVLEPESYVEITHGWDEYGKDLVVLRKDPFGNYAVGIVVKVGNIRDFEVIRGETLLDLDQIYGWLTKSCLKMGSPSIYAPYNFYLPSRFAVSGFTGSPGAW